MVHEPLRGGVHGPLSELQAIVTSLVRYTSWIAFSRLTPSCIGRWKAFLPEIKPVPPARLLMTAVLTASFKSLSPDEAPPELIRPARPIKQFATWYRVRSIG